MARDASLTGEAAMATIEEKTRPWRADRVWKAISLVPFFEALAISVFTASYFSPLYSKPPDIVGVPFGLVLEVALLAWAVLGAAVIWTARSPAVATLAVLATTAPAMVLQIFIPGLVLIMQNLTV